MFKKSCFNYSFSFLVITRKIENFFFNFRTFLRHLFSFVKGQDYLRYVTGIRIKFKNQGTFRKIQTRMCYKIRIRTFRKTILNKSEFNKIKNLENKKEMSAFMKLILIVSGGYKIRIK